VNREERIHFAISYYQRSLRLGDWDIRYAPDWDGSTEDSATVHSNVSSKAATIRLDPDVTGDNIDAHIAHELVHLVLQPYTMAAQNSIAKHGPGVESVLDILSDMEEVICEQIAHALTGITYIPVGPVSRKTLAPFDTRESDRQDAEVVLHTMQGENQ